MVIVFVDFQMTELTVSCRISYIVVIHQRKVVKVACKVISYVNSVSLPPVTCSVVFIVFLSPILSTTELEKVLGVIVVIIHVKANTVNFSLTGGLELQF